MSESNQYPGGVLATLMAKYAELPKLEGCYYRDQNFQIDGYHFVSCRFDRCVLSIASANFKLENCVVDDTTRFYFDTDPTKIVKVASLKWPWIANGAPTLSATWNANGTFSIL
jgi:hypothetical protein